MAISAKITTTAAILTVGVLFRLVSSTGQPVVRVVYLVPSDREEMPQARQGSLSALRHLQRWYHAQLGNGTTFALAKEDDVFRTIKSKHDSDWYRQHPLGDTRKYYWFQNAVQEVRDNLWFTKDLIVILLDADVEGHEVEAAAHRGGTFAVMPWRYVRAFAGQNIEPPCRAVGVLGHELGHMFGLEHPVTCSSGGYKLHSTDCAAIMGYGAHYYPGTSLTSADRSKVRAHPAMRPMEIIPSEDFDCDRLLFAGSR